MFRVLGFGLIDTDIEEFSPRAAHSSSAGATLFARRVPPLGANSAGLPYWSPATCCPEPYP